VDDDILKFLRARLADDEKAAKEAPSELGDGEWPFWVDPDDHDARTAAERFRDHFRPKRILAEVNAKRRILDELLPEVVGTDEMVDDEWRNGCDNAGALLQMLALPYAYHDDYQDEWRP
jgi:hypothetical protein